MTSTSQKHRDFISEPMGEKDVTYVAGIGPVYAAKLKEQGFNKAYVLLGQFLLLKKDEDDFVFWLNSVCGANSRYSKACYNCLKEWSLSFL